VKTIKQIADELGVDKQRVYRYIKANHINEAHQERGVMYFTDVVEKAVIRYFYDETTSSDVHHDVHQTTSNDTVVVALKQELNAKNAQLEVKDKQIDALNARLADVTAALIGAQDAARAAQALHAGTIQAQLGDGRRDGFWARLFRGRDGQKTD
jgi:AcrR family transcriptional regulator